MTWFCHFPINIPITFFGFSLYFYWYVAHPQLARQMGKYSFTFFCFERPSPSFKIVLRVQCSGLTVFFFWDLYYVSAFSPLRVSGIRSVVSLIGELLKVIWYFSRAHSRIFSLGFAFENLTVMSHDEAFLVIRSCVCFLYFDGLIFLQIKEVFCYYFTE